MSDFILKCLENGKEIEKSGIKFYKDAAESIEDPKGKSRTANKRESGFQSSKKTTAKLKY